MEQARIVVVEDEAIVAHSLQQTLARLGYTVPAIAATGAEAIQQASATRPDLVLMDIQLAGAMDGVAAAQEIRQRFDIPVVYLTAYSDTAIVRRVQPTAP